ncbi:hypothetical protein IWW36_001106 [Coemansia brasiliensis]|uniref:Mannosyltransferase n=1 Tax=Coemansia brasiliensis TaxID=2650707 RepID=A0A9W8IC91_9FUNG|nr:hypothetical protein IWW36_001106 [Coemansia brasiliensis]
MTEPHGRTRLRNRHEWSSYAVLLVLRIVNALLIQTYIHPDETWQSLEVAHRLAFGYGFVTWEWRHALRGFAHPMLFAAVYRMLWLLGLDNSFLVVSMPLWRSGDGGSGLGGAAYVRFIAGI